MISRALLIAVCAQCAACSSTPDRGLDGVPSDQLVAFDLVIQHHPGEWFVPGPACGPMDSANVVRVPMPPFGPDHSRRLQAGFAHNKRAIALHGPALGCDRFQPDMITSLK